MVGAWSRPRLAFPVSPTPTHPQDDNDGYDHAITGCDHNEWQITTLEDQTAAYTMLLRRAQDEPHHQKLPITLAILSQLLPPQSQTRSERCPRCGHVR